MTIEQRQYDGAKRVFSTNGFGTLSIHMPKKENPDTDLISFTKINSIKILDLNVECRFLLG